MRPEILYPLFAEITVLPGVGPRLAQLYTTLAGPRVLDLCWHLPSGIIDRRYAPKLDAAEPGRIATLVLRVTAHEPAPSRRRPYRIHCSDDTGEIELVFFHARTEYLQRILPEGELRAVSGKIEVFNGRLQMTHPDHIGRLEELDGMKKVEPVYPLTAGLTQNPVAKAVRAALETAPELPEWLDPAYRQRQNWPGWLEALKIAHGPDGEEALSPLLPARRRLAYDELLANQLALALVRERQQRLRGRVFRGDGALRKKAIAALPFALTGSQETAVAEIIADMESPDRMLRLLQGDVGSGKTLVAFLAMLNAVEAGAQAAMMAPTEILARQHFKTLSPFAEAAGVTLELLTGRDKGKQRTEKLARLEAGETRLTVGTHALFQKDIAFKDLGLAVVDEQHRFGVHQRLGLGAKGQAVDMLVMTATPIPRTLMLTAYGDMEGSRLTEKPAGRMPVDTRVVPL